MPVRGFGTLIPDPAETIIATRTRWRLVSGISIVAGDFGSTIWIATSSIRRLPFNRVMNKTR